MSRKIANRQAAAMLNAPPFEANIGIHNVPFIGFEAVIRQHFARRLNAFFALLLFRPFRLFCPFPGINANQRSQVRQPQLPRLDFTFQFWSWLAGGVDQRTVDIAIANAPIKTAIIKDRRFFSVDFRYQPTIRFKRRCIGQQNARQFIEITQRIARKFKP